ncbi:hypothetical protein NO559_14845 [Dasania sp. GY-MA-18]|uniref:Uncharacterized protein n=1 Tax=Dasania phycosphaerae TaxID=2950436 RepID=A0A9J6RR42_9GAMM|nr:MULTISPECIES: hypothetical protein [Dasania]MCR8924059.1 hypothetical protein [Dasania sp. GY-MA-18]MCZ0866632.1 hypothetical protein [Dasania phycosphaerae]MCZ0870217.1 hypothetical protein [Dasania phycosphaerae]
MTRAEQLKTSIEAGLIDDVEWLVEGNNAPIGWEHVQLAIDSQQPAVAEQLKTYIKLHSNA